MIAFGSWVQIPTALRFLRSDSVGSVWSIWWSHRWYLNVLLHYYLFVWSVFLIAFWLAPPLHSLPTLSHSFQVFSATHDTIVAQQYLKWWIHLPSIDNICRNCTLIDYCLINNFNVRMFLFLSVCGSAIVAIVKVQIENFENWKN